MFWVEALWIEVSCLGSCLLPVGMACLGDCDEKFYWGFAHSFTVRRKEELSMMGG
jgi:hypothetical protein